MGPTDVLLGDTMGELRKFYLLGTIVFVGRSLVSMGGSDPIEAAALGKPLLSGPHMENFAVPVRCLTEAAAMRTVTGAAELAKAVQTMLANPGQLREMGDRARQVVLDNQGATARHVEAIRSVALSVNSNAPAG